MNLVTIAPPLINDIENSVDNNDADDENNVDDNDEEIDETVEKVSLSQKVCMYQKIKIFSLQRFDREFSQKLFKMAQEMENAVFSEKKEYTQQQLDFYFNS